MPKSLRIDDGTENEPKFRFGLTQMFYALTLLATGYALTSWTAPFSLFAIVGWIYVCSKANRDKASAISVVWVVFLAVCIGLFIPPFSHWTRFVAKRTACQNNMRRLMIATLNYENAHGALPNATARSTDGKFKHSWRVMIIPFLDTSGRDDGYNYDEPWNSPSNSKFATRMPEVFSCPENPIPNKTPYKLVVDKGTAFEPGTSISWNGFRDDSSSTIAMVEDVNNQVNWLEPDDLTIAEALELLNNMDKSCCAHAASDTIFATSFGVVNAALLDGSVYAREINPDKNLTGSAFTINDGEREQLDWSGQTIKEIKPQGYIAFGAYLLLIFLPLVSIWRRNQ